MLESYLYSNVFVHYGHWFMSGQNQQLFELFKPINDSFSVVSIYIFEETYILLESPFHTELSGLCTNSVR